MKHVIKRTEPATIRDTRLAATTNLTTTATARVAFDQINKQEVREQLAEEQRHLCAFCMRRIEPHAREGRAVTMKIAHRTPIDVDPSLALSWTNLLGSCDGGEGSSGRVRTCDAAQGNSPLTVDPTVGTSVARLFYESRSPKVGIFITSEDPALREDVDWQTRHGKEVPGVLALNTGDLPELRWQAWNAFREKYRLRHPSGPYGKPAYRTYFPKWSAEAAPRHPEMVAVIEEKIR